MLKPFRLEFLEPHLAIVNQSSNFTRTRLQRGFLLDGIVGLPAASQTLASYPAASGHTVYRLKTWRPIQVLGRALNLPCRGPVREFLPTQ